MFDSLYKEPGWIVCTFKDGSKLVFYTTYNSEILDQFGGAREGFLLNLETYRWISLDCLQGSSPEYYADRPDVEEVYYFATRFVGNHA
jgi:hypothetical protein